MHDTFNIQHYSKLHLKLLANDIIKACIRTCVVSRQLCVYRKLFLLTPVRLAMAPSFGVKAREPPCSWADEMLRQREWMCVYYLHPCERIWEPFITFPSCWAKIMPPLLSSSPTQWASLRGYPVGEVNAFILLAAVLVTQDLQNVPPASTYLFTILCIE